MTPDHNLKGIKIWLNLLRLLKVDVQATLSTPPNCAPKGFVPVSTQETEQFTLIHTIEDGIERIVYRPQKRRFQTPILMQHGMWHGAWCWQLWQELLAEWGWESHAFSLPGHAGSPEQRPIATCTLDYYLSFLKAEVERLPCRPVLMGHSMGGALTQWYLKYVGDDLPAAVLVAPWVSHSMNANLLRPARLDPLGAILMFLSGTATPFMRTPERAAKALLSPQAVYTPQQLHAQLGPESVLVLAQHNPPFWSPPKGVKTPLLWLAGEVDAVIGERLERRSAAYYQAEYVLIEQAGHNLMMAHNYRQTAETIHCWLVKQRIN
jgi:pimeloyl-ACP methyl ester carboxylesterase